MRWATSRKKILWVHYGFFAFMLAFCAACSFGNSAPPRVQATPPHVQATPTSRILPGYETWKQGASSLLFGTNDTYEFYPQNLETQPVLQDLLRSAGFTSVRSFFKDNASDTQIEQRIQAIENSGAHCLGVITNVFDTSYDEHLVQYLGNRCLLYEFGNEPDASHVSVDMYLEQWNSLIPVLRRINPAAKFVGPVVSGGYTGAKSFLRNYLMGVKSSGVLPDAVSFHWYPCYRRTESSCLGRASSVIRTATDVRHLVKNILGKDLPVGITEWNFDPGNPPAAYGDNSDFITSFSTTALQSMIQAGVTFANQFDAASYAGYGHLDLFDVRTSMPKPQYYAIKAMIAQYRLTSSVSSSTGTPLLTEANGPLISRGKPTYCSSNNRGPGGPQAIVGGHYGTYAYWDTQEANLPGWCAVQVGSGPSRVLLTWECDFTQSHYLASQNPTPQDYSIAVSADSTNGADGTWQTVVQVSGNQASIREHVFSFSGKSWVKMTVTRGQLTTIHRDIAINQIDIYDASADNSLDNTFFFSGDSITAYSYNRSDTNQPSFAEAVHASYPQLFPATMDGGIGGASSDAAVRDIDLWLSLNPDMHYWLLEWGTNDAFGSTSPAHFQANLQILVDKIKQAGHIPIFAKIPYNARPNDAALNQEIEALNGAIDQITKANGLINGPDFYQLFSQHAQEYFRSDHVHPNADGAIAMNLAWFDTLQPYIFR